MIFKTMVKRNGVYYMPGEDVPELKPEIEIEETEVNKVEVVPTEVQLSLESLLDSDNYNDEVETKVETPVKASKTVRKSNTKNTNTNTKQCARKGK